MTAVIKIAFLPYSEPPSASLDQRLESRIDLGFCAAPDDDTRPSACAASSASFLSASTSLFVGLTNKATGADFARSPSSNSKRFGVSDDTTTATAPVALAPGLL